MKPDVRVVDGKVIVEPKAEDAVTRLRRLRLQKKLADGGRLTDDERDLILLALGQELGIL